MATVRINDLEAVTSGTSGSVVEIEQGGVSKKITMSDFLKQMFTAARFDEDIIFSTDGENKIILPTSAGTLTIELVDGTDLLTIDNSGNVTVLGNLTGNVTGDLTGDVTGGLTGDVTGNVTGDVTGNVTGDVTGNVTGNVTGDVTGNVTGDLAGDITSDTTIHGNINYTGVQDIDTNTRYLKGTNTGDEIFSALDSYIPNTGDIMPLNGGHLVGSTFVLWVYATRTSSSNIRIETVNAATGDSIENIVEGDTDTKAVVLSW